MEHLKNKNKSKNMFISGPKLFGHFLKVAIERSHICAANEADLECYTICGCW